MTPNEKRGTKRKKNKPEENQSKKPKGDAAPSTSEKSWIEDNVGKLAGGAVGLPTATAAYHFIKKWVIPTIRINKPFTPL